MDIIIREENGFRNLQFGPKLIQGSMQLDAPHAVVMEYAREMFAPLLLNSDPTWPRTALFVGLGTGSMPRFLHFYKPDCAITTVEISRQVVAAARTHFHVPPDSEKFQVVVQCGSEFMQNCTQQFDLIVMDAYTEDFQISEVHTELFFRNCKARLSPQGYIVTNFIVIHPAYQTILNRFIKAFDPVSWTLKAGSTRNSISMSHVGAGFELRKEVLEENCKKLREKTGLDLSVTLAKMCESLPV